MREASHEAKDQLCQGVALAFTRQQAYAAAPPAQNRTCPASHERLRVAVLCPRVTAAGWPRTAPKHLKSRHLTLKYYTLKAEFVLEPFAFPLERPALEGAGFSL